MVRIFNPMAGSQLYCCENLLDQTLQASFIKPQTAVTFGLAPASTSPPKFTGCLCVRNVWENNCAVVNNSNQWFQWCNPVVPTRHLIHFRKICIQLFIHAWQQWLPCLTLCCSRTTRNPKIFFILLLLFFFPNHHELCIQIQAFYHVFDVRNMVPINVPSTSTRRNIKWWTFPRARFLTASILAIF